MLATPKGMKSAALTQRQRRGSNVTHRFVLGAFVREGVVVLLRAVECGPGWNIIRPVRLTRNCELFYRWRTKQAALQFRDRWGLDDVHVIDLGWLDVLPTSRFPEDNAAVGVAGAIAVAGVASSSRGGAEIR